MKARLANVYYAIRTSFWFIPLLLAMAALIGAVMSLHLDFEYAAHRLTSWMPGPPITQEGARLVVSAIASSMITATSLVFSMTLVALSFVSQQLGPRLILRFMEDRPTQFVLGIFIATFVYSVIVLGVIGTRASQDFIPVFSVYMCGLLAILSLGVIIFFIHHTAMNIQADAVVARLGQQLTTAIEDNEERNEELCIFMDAAAFASACDDVRARGTPVMSVESGYVQSIDEGEVRRVALEHDIRICLNYRPGQFVLRGMPLAHAAARTGNAVPARCEEELQSFFVLGEQRTRQQHVEFEINALVEVALRALSPSMNDPLTAVACVNRIFVGLRQLLGHRNQMRVLIDDEKEPLIFPLPQGFGHYLDTAVTPLRRAGKDDLIFIQNLLARLHELASLSSDGNERDSIRDQILALSSDYHGSELHEFDEKRLGLATQKALEATLN